MKASALVELLRDMAGLVDSGQDVLLSAAEQIRRDQATITAAAEEVTRLQIILPAEPTR